MTTTEDTTLRQRLDAALQDLVNRQHMATGPVPPITMAFSIQEIQSLAEMLRADEPPDTTGVGPGSYSVTLSYGTQFSVTGPGIHNRSDVPVFTREADAESMCRCMSLAFRVGQRQRSLQLRLLLDLKQ